MNKTDSILERLKSQPKPAVDQPDLLTDSIMARLPEQDAPKVRQVGRLWRYVVSAMAVAAGILLLLVLQFQTDDAVEKSVAVQQPEPMLPKPTATPTQRPDVSGEKQIEVRQVAEAQPIVKQPAAVRKRPVHQSVEEEVVETTVAATDSIVSSSEEMFATIIINPNEDIELEFRKQTESLRQRGELMMQRVAMLNPQMENNISYHVESVEL